jgi:carboxyl-terminal processing protease
MTDMKALVALLLALIPAAALADALPSSIAADVNESYRLLAKTYYKPIDGQTLVDAARAAIVDEANKHHVRVNLSDAPAADNQEATIAWIDDSIVAAAEASHTAPTPFAYAVMTGMAKAVGDRYTTFMTPEEYRAFNSALDPEKISGIGVLIAPDQATGLMSLSYVVPGTPADKSGLVSGDILYTVDGTSTKGLTVENTSKLLRGRAGTNVHLEVDRSSEHRRSFDITRSEIQPPTVVAKMLPDGIGYIYVIAFGKETPGQFDLALRRLHDAKALVVDLRNDGGGYVDSALEMASRFIANHPLLTVQQRGLPDATIPAGDDVSVNVPVTMLVNKYTASASEIMAGAMQDDGIAALVGTRTFGKGVMQTLTPLADGAAIKITTAHYLTPRHHDINLRGIDPDVQIEEPSDSRLGEVAHDPQLRAAMAFLQKKIAESETPKP